MSKTLEEFRAALADYETQAMVYGATTADLPLLVAARERVVDLFLAPAPSTTRAPGGGSGCACGGKLGGPPMWPVTHSAKKCVQHRATCDAVLELIGAPPWAPPSPVLPEERGTSTEDFCVCGHRRGEHNRMLTGQCGAKNGPHVICDCTGFRQMAPRVLPEERGAGAKALVAEADRLLTEYARKTGTTFIGRAPESPETCSADPTWRCRPEACETGMLSGCVGHSGRAAPETPATGPCDECGGPFYEGRRGWPVHQVGAGWSRKVHERCSSALSPGATRGDGRTP